LVSEGGVSAGVRRIEAVTGLAALAHIQSDESRLHQLAQLLGGSVNEIAPKLHALLERQKGLERDINALKAKAAHAVVAELATTAKKVGGIKLVAARLEGIDAKALREAVDGLKQQLGNAVVVLAGVNDGKASLVAGVAGAALERVRAGDLLAHLARLTGGKGGGRPDLAQGGAPDGAPLVNALAGIAEWVATSAHSDV